MALVARQTATESGGPFIADTSAELVRTTAEVLNIRTGVPPGVSDREACFAP